VGGACCLFEAMTELHGEEGSWAKALSLGRRTLDRETAVLRKLGYIRKSDKDNRSPWVVLK